MATINEYESNGVKLLVQFTCYRCKKVHVEDLAPLAKRAGDHYGYLHNLPKPEGWTDYMVHSKLLCDTCTTELVKFFKDDNR